MSRLYHQSYNASLNAVELIDTISGNIVGYGKAGHRAQRWNFSNYMYGGEINPAGYSMRQGGQEPRIGEWTKVMIRGRGFFMVHDSKADKVMYTRLGDFHLDGVGNLVSKEGYKVIGTPLTGSATRLNTPDPADPTAIYTSNKYRDANYGNPYDTMTHNMQVMNPPGKPVSTPEAINLQMDPRNGKYLGLYDSIKVAEDGVIYGKDGTNLVSLYKLQISNFNNAEGLHDAKDGVYFTASKESGNPSLYSGDSIVISEALERSNTWVKVETHYMTEAQRYYQAATQLHKLADKITGTAIEMIQ
jgi:flagellar hook protein FlgE